MKNSLWGASYENKPIHIVLFVSRNKDNAGVEGFKERHASFITTKDKTEVLNDFNAFVESGVEGEMSRMYFSVNARDPKKIYSKLMHFLFDEPEFNLCSIQPKLAGLAAQKDCATEHHWMFDFDIDSPTAVVEFIDDVYNIDPEVAVDAFGTPHGYAIIAEHGFDTRTLMEKWGDNVSLKRDDMLCYNWKTKGEK